MAIQNQRPNLSKPNIAGNNPIQPRGDYSAIERGIAGMGKGISGMIESKQAQEAAQAKAAEMAFHNDVSVFNFGLLQGGAAGRNEAILRKSQEYADAGDMGNYEELQKMALMTPAQQQQEIMNDYLSAELAKDPTQNPADILAKVNGGGGADPDFLKEERKYAKEGITNLKKRSTEIQSSFNKLNGLVTQIKSGTGGRQAVSAAVTALSRLISPGIVTDKDFTRQLGVAPPVAALMEVVTSGGAGAKDAAASLRQYFDPTNPDYINPDSLLTTAKNVTAAEVPVLMQELEESKSRARTSGMSDVAYNANFGSIGSIEALSRFLPDAGADTALAGSPPVGTVKSGYVFKGGNPNDKSNWDKQ